LDTVPESIGGAARPGAAGRREQAADAGEPALRAGGRPRRASSPLGYRLGMTTLIIVLLVLWAVFAVVGFVVEGLLWLAFIGLILLAATIAWGWIKRRTSRD
jgi:uncharacterized membrane protein